MKTLNEIYSSQNHPMIHALKASLGREGHRYGGADSRFELDTEAEKRGYHLHVLGSGVMGSAIHHPQKDQVYKVYKDPAYHSFAQLAKAKGAENPTYPKIHAIGKVKGTGIGVVRMERLEPLHDSHPLHDVEFKQRRKTGSDVLHTLHHTFAGDQIKKHFPDFHKALSEIAEAHPNTRFDLHGGNVMQRGHGRDATPVITDPIIQGSSSGFDRGTKKTPPSEHHTKTFASDIPIKAWEPRHPHITTNLSDLMKDQLTFTRKGSHWALRPKKPNSTELTHPPTLKEDGVPGAVAPTNNVGSGHIAGAIDGNPPVYKKPLIFRRKLPELVGESEGDKE